MAQRIEREIEVFNTALELPSAERAAYLAVACADDAALRRRVAELLELDESEPDFLASPVIPPLGPPTLSQPERLPAENVGDRIGNYRLIAQLGEGGCGVVYLAEQERPVRRQVALKIIKLGMDTRSVIARFEAERQVLALMEHPNIAKVLDAGATATGRPYFVMELARGLKITDYCDAHNLSAPARLSLFVQVCRAVQHAHQKGIIHRDLKPPNILVTITDGVATPKVIDFGIAKATQGKRTDQTVFTALEQFIGTPAYMSPEQTEASALDIDTRSDIYSLGVLLYELLTGQTPFDSRELLQVSLDEMRRKIREQDPARPSTRLRTMLAGDLTQVAAHRQTQPLKLIHQVRGDLDWIVMKCLEKDRSRRYETANGLAADIQRHLGNEPVTARPPSKRYALQKLVRRHTLVFACTGVVAAALVFALVVTMVALVRMRRDDQQTRQAKNDAIEKLRSSYLAEARATRLSGQPGGRFDSLTTVQKAAAIRPDMAVRNEVIACLAVSDLEADPKKTITGHPRDELAKFDFNLDHYAFGDTNGTVTIRAATNDLVLAVLPAPGLAIETVGEFSADGNYLSVRYWNEGNGETDLVWDWRKRQVLVRLRQTAEATNPGNFYFANDFSPDNRYFFSSGPDGAISVYDLAAGGTRRQLPGRHGYHHLIADSTVERLACSSRDDSQVEIRDLPTGRLLQTISCPPGVSAMAWSADGARLATAGMDFNIHIWDVNTGEQTALLTGHSTFIMSVVFSHAGDLLASTSYEDLVRLWNPENGRQLASHRGAGWQLQFSPDDRRLRGWHEGSHFGSLAVGYSRECRLLSLPGHADYVSPPAFDADGRILAATTEFGANFWDTRSGERIGSFPLPDGDAVIFTPDGRSLITVDRIAGIRQRTMERRGGPASMVWRLGPPRAIFEGNMMQDASLSQDGRYLAATQPLNGQSYIFDLQNPGARVVLPGHIMGNRIAESPDGRWAATASWYNSLVKIWDTRSGACVHLFSEPARSFVCFSPDGCWLATSSSQYQLWKVGTWQPKGTARLIRDDPVGGFTAFSPDNRLMARTESNKIMLFDTATEKILATLEAPGASTVLSCSFSPDGCQLAAKQMDKQIQLWDLRLIRQELAQMNLDWDQPPYPPEHWVASVGPVTLEIESETNSRGR